MEEINSLVSTVEFIITNSSVNDIKDSVLSDELT